MAANGARAESLRRALVPSVLALVARCQRAARRARPGGGNAHDPEGQARLGEVDGPFGSMDYTARDGSPACPKTQSLNSWTTGLRLEDGVVTSRYRAGAATHRSKRGIRIPCSSSCAIIEVRLMRGPHAPDGGLDQQLQAQNRRTPMFCCSSSLRVSWHSKSTARCGRENRADRCLPACQNGSPSHSLSLNVCKT